MVKRIAGAWSFTSDEFAVFGRLSDTEARADPEGLPTGAGTGVFTRTRVALSLGQAQSERYEQVDHATCLRLEKAGLVHIDRGGYAHLTDDGREAINQDQEQS